jgi:hypothetical protein
MLLLIVVVVVVVASIDWILGPSLLGPVEREEGCRRDRQRAECGRECGRDRTREDYLIFHLCDP